MARSPKTPKLSKSSKQVDALKHDAASRKNIPTAEMESFFRRDEDASPMPPKHYPRARPLAEGATRTAEEPHAPELIWNGAKITITDAQMKELAETGTLTLADAQLVWRGKDRQDWSDLVVNVPPLYIQEKIHPKAIIDDLKRRTAETREAQSQAPDLFADFNGIEADQRAEFYQHDQHWSNRMILGDSLQVMASLAERESLRGDNFASIIQVQKTGGQSSALLASTVDFILWYAKDRYTVKYWQIYLDRQQGHTSLDRYDQILLSDGSRRRLSKSEVSDRSLAPSGRFCREQSLLSAGASSNDQTVILEGRTFRPAASSHWKTTPSGVERLYRASRISAGKSTISYLRLVDDFPIVPVHDRWESMQIGTPLDYIVQTSPKIVERCILMATDPGDLVLDPTCGSGTTAYVAEQWGRRWITIDTSRVALALARTRLMAARYPWYLLADSRDGRAKESDLQKRVLPDTPVHNDIRQGFVYERVPHITLKSIANNPLIDDIWEKWQAVLEPLRTAVNTATKNTWEEWQIPCELPAGAPAAAKEPHAKWWEARIARQREIDASIAARADVEFLYDRPYTDNARVRVAGPFTVESLSPHRVLPASEEELIDLLDAADGKRSAADADHAGQDFSTIVMDYLKSEGVKQQDKDDRITFESLTPWPGDFIGASGTFIEGENGPERRAAILIGPEYGTVGRQDIVAAAREAVDARFDVLIACAFNFDAHSSELGSLGSLKILKARINPDMHMSDELKNTGRGNMFVVFGEPDVEILDDGGPEIRMKVNGIDVFDPNTGDIRSNDTKGIAAWFIDTDYNEESFFVRHAYFLGANDPYKSLKTALQAEIDEDAWATLYSDTSRPFTRPTGGRIAVKVINHFGDEVMKVFAV